MVAPLSPQAPLEAVTALLRDPRIRNELHYHSFVFPAHRVLYMETPKAACTATKVALLALTGRTLADLNQGALPRPFPEAIVHDRRSYPAKSLAELDRDELREVITSPSWLRFCVVRDPFSRTFSAWEGKVFLGDAGMLDRFQTLGSGDVFDGDRLDIRATFCAFVEDLAKRKDHYFEDMHFRPQCDVVRSGVVPYTHVVNVSSLVEFVPSLNAHLRSSGNSLSLEIPRVHEGLGVPWLNSYDQQAIDRVADLYAEDIERFQFAVPIATGAELTLLDPIAQRLLSQLRQRVRQVAAVGQLLASTEPD